MRAVMQQEFGGPEVLKVADVPAPTPLPSEVVVAVHAAGLNPVEGVIRSGAFPLLGQPPFVLGWDLSGVISEVVPGVNRFQVGDKVYGMPLFPRPAGTYAELVAAPSRQLARKPRSIDHVHAAALPLAGLTAWQSLVDIAAVEPGQVVLVHGAGGGVGHLAVQIAKHLGAHVVGTASAGKHAFVQELGADEVIDYRTVDFAEAVGDVDVVLDLVGGNYGARSIGVLRPGGLLVTAVDRTNSELATRTRAEGRRFAGITVEPDGAGLERLAELVDSGQLRVHVEHAIPLKDAARAHALLQAGLPGKAVLTMVNHGVDGERQTTGHSMPQKLVDRSWLRAGEWLAGQPLRPEAHEVKPDTMRAVVLRGFGDPEVLHVEAVEVPEPGPDQVRVTVAAAAVNPVDLATRAGVLPDSSTSWPLILGWDAAGTVSAVGREVTTLSIRQPVVGMSFQPATQVGTYAEHVALAAEDVAVRPDELTAEAAATIPLAGLTALQALNLLNPTTDETLFINGVLGANGGFAASLARLAGARVIAAVPKDEIDAARSLGVDLVLDRHREVTAQVKGAFPDGVDASLDVAGGATARAALAVTRDDGRYVTVAPGWWRPGGPDVANPGRPVSAQEVQVSLNGDQLRQLVQLMARGELKSRVAHRLPLEQAIHAHELQAAGGLRGKIMLIPSLGQTP